MKNLFVRCLLETLVFLSSLTLILLSFHSDILMSIQKHNSHFLHIISSNLPCSLVICLDQSIVASASGGSIIVIVNTYFKPLVTTR